MAIKKNTKDTLTAAEIKEIKKQLEELKADADVLALLAGTGRAYYTPCRH